ncbi:hypothetical protein BPAE_0222g00050 [Botrytis paeoniae]|uniref:RING-type domain-containing protein n=1 Tax=Botrytis paeoniae TaxID=278948 RepID=A0A4Z1FF32_9HELO|nr:hypothetical protein BPAE_0222g00050 [Botrytis paeoniae]
MVALNAPQAEGTDPIVLVAEPEEGNGAAYLDQYYLLGDDSRLGLSNTGALPERITNSRLQAGVGNFMRQEIQDIYYKYIGGVQEQRNLEITTMPRSLEKKDAIRALLKPVKSSTDELSLCFCKEPYADTTAKIDDNSHEPVKMPDCPHFFGKCCIVQWLGDNSPPTCPICRKVVHLPRNRPVTRNGTDDVYSIIDYHY